ncbi:MAG: c-type cytochrome [Thiohalocapsa sp.]|jgi:cytochrome c peroxidase|uniref:cytochrome-c peroxidase n=1 Tax=Thiohalocapsa sp. TaxID=2497641 RepID=UPI0025F25482|nr:cytochrome c peroxidase [Thiohalocapsa sp.]MCG6939920.1 c-type cytochrome [Thiohalocapsa sp.]
MSPRTPVLLAGALSLGFTLSSSMALAAWEALPEQPPIPADNPQNDAKILLGKTLYFDPRFSEHGTLSCNSCHNVMAAGDDNRPNSIGMHDARGGRSAPTVWNAAFYSVQFWDGRAATLEDQAKGPVVNPVEMGMENLEAAMARLRQIDGYTPMFQAAFPGDDNPVTADNAAKAVAAFERTLITPDSAYDRYARGDDSAMTEQQVRGMETFAELGCTACHSGANFSGPQLPMGTGFFQKFPTYPGSDYEAKYDLTTDNGRFEATGNDADKHMWRVPTLRNVALTAPYFHNGSVPTLNEAVHVMAKTQLNKDLTDEQAADLVAFLNALSGDFPEMAMPRLPGTPGMSVIPPVDPHMAQNQNPHK